jgi:diaminopimelate epimerase
LIEAPYMTGRKAAMHYFKMNGAGNEFIILDARGQGKLTLSPERVRAIAAWKPFDQLIAIEPDDTADVFMRFWNADGGEVGACGNGTRAAAWLLLEENGADRVTMQTVGGQLAAARAGALRVAVDMGKPRLDWREIPVARATDTVAMDYSFRAPDGAVFEKPGGVNMGNPHAVFFVPDAEAAPASIVGPLIEHDPFFPERVNVGFAQILAPDRIRLRVWERGAGLTKACGTGACAALIAAHRRGLAGRKARVIVDGGELDIEWRDDDHVIMTGPVELEGEGETAV